MPATSRVLALGALAGIVALGSFARLHALGAHPLAVDEYYFAVAVDGWFEHGMPELPGGGIYTRGAAAQVLSVASVAALGAGEAAYRLPMALCGLLAALLTGFYARAYVGAPLAALAAALMLLSSWEIEFSRFARMYAPLQCVTLGFLLAARRARGRTLGELLLPSALLALALLTHAISVVLIPLAVIPAALLARRRGPRGVLAAAAALVGLAAFSAVVILDPFRTWGLADALPQDFVALGPSRMRLPGFPFWSLGRGPLVDLAALLGAIGVSGALAAFPARRSPSAAVDRALGGAALAAAALHALGIALLCAALLVARTGGALAHAAGRWARRVLAGVALASAGWIAIALADPDWTGRLAGAEGASLLGALRRTFFGFPDYFAAWIVPWSQEMPRLGALLAAAAAVQAVRAARGPWPAAAWSPGVVLLWVATAIAMLSAPYPTTRYSFFVYPVALVAAVATARDAAAWVVRRLAPVGAEALAPALAVVACVGIAATTEDCHPSHPFRVATPEVGLRIGPWERFAHTWYPRWDFRSPARVLEARPGVDADPVIVAGLPPVSYYLRMDHAVFYARADRRFANVSRARGTVDLWSGRRLLGLPEDLRRYAQGAKRVWIVRAVEEEPGLELPASETWPDCGPPERVHTSVDGRIEVVRLELPCPASSRGAVR